MKKNSYQLQHEIFTKVVDGVSKTELWDELRGRRDELEHLCQGGNPSLNQYREEMSNVASEIRREFDRAAEFGPFAQRALSLQFQSIELAGRVCEDISRLEPATITDTEDIRDSHQRLMSSINADALRDCDLVLDGKYKGEIDSLYGKVGEPDAEDLTQ